MLFHKISGIVLSSLFRFSFSKTFYWLKACFDNEDVVVHSLKFSSSFNWKFRHREPCFSLNYLNYHGNWFFFSWADAACLFSLHFLENCLPQIFHLSGFFFSWTDLTCWASESVEKSITNVRPKRLKTLNNYHQNHLLTFFFLFLWCRLYRSKFCWQHQISQWIISFRIPGIPPIVWCLYEVEFPSLANKKQKTHKKRKKKKKLKYFLRSGSFFTLFSCFVFP